MNKKIFKHLKKDIKPKLVNVSKKNITIRKAKAEGIVKFSKEVYNKIIGLTTAKGEIMNTSILAGIIGAKKTSEIIPLCHNIPIEDVDIDIKVLHKKNSFKITCSIITSSKTGVEMEALTGVSVTCLTIYDMCKSIDKSIIIERIQLLSKSGGKSGNYRKK